MSRWPTTQELARPRRDQSESQRIRRHFRHAAIGVVALGAALGLIHAVWADWAHAAWGAICVAGASTYFASAVGLRRPRLIRWGMLGVTGLTFGFSLGYPLSPSLLSFFLPVALVFASLTRSPWVAARNLGGLLLVPIAWAWFDLPRLPDPSAPGELTFVATVTVAGVMAWVSVASAGGRMRDRLARLLDAERELAARRAEVHAQHTELTRLNRDLARTSKRVADLTAREAAQTATLAATTGDQEGLGNAIHHDLREPLRGIVSFAQLVDRRLAAAGDSGAKAREYVAFATDAGRRMAAMLTDLQRYTRLENEEMAEVQLDSLVGDLRVDLADTLERHGGRLLIGSELPVVRGFPTQLRQLLQNLIVNALKFHRAGTPPRVEIAFERGRGLIVRDNGIGIPAERLEDVFGLFNRAHATEGYEGSGVGLALCRRIALAHDATLHLSSEVGVGTTFVVAGLQVIADRQFALAAHSTEEREPQIADGAAT